MFNKKIGKDVKIPRYKIQRDRVGGYYYLEYHSGEFFGRPMYWKVDDLKLNCIRACMQYIEANDNMPDRKLIREVAQIY